MSKEKITVEFKISGHDWREMKLFACGRKPEQVVSDMNKGEQQVDIFNRCQWRLPAKGGE
jgi:hypothetical protein